MKRTLATLWLILAFVSLSVSSLWADSVGIWTGSSPTDHSAGYSDSYSGRTSTTGGWTGALTPKSTVTLGGTGVRYNAGGGESGGPPVPPWIQLAPTMNPTAGTVYAGGLVRYVLQGTRGTDPSSVAATPVMKITPTGCTASATTTTFFQKGLGDNNWHNICNVTLNSGVTTPTVVFEWSANATSRIYADSFQFNQITCDQIARPSGITPPVLPGATTVQVLGCTNAGLQSVKVYNNDWSVKLGETDTTTGGTVNVTVTALTNGDTIRVVQMVNGVETCHDLTAPSAVVGVDCTQTPKPTSISGAYVDNPNPVTVGGVNINATDVKLFDASTSSLLIDVPFTGGNTPATVNIDCTGLLVAGHTIYAEQTVAGIDSCSLNAPSTTVLALRCQATAALSPSSAIDGPLAAGQTSVHVVTVDAGATNVIVYTNGVPAGTNTATSGTAVNVTVFPLIKGSYVSATQVKNGIESCVQTSGPIVGGGANPKLRVALDLYITPANNTVAMGATARISGSNLPNPTTVLTPSVGWQTVSWTYSPSICMNYADGTSPYTIASGSQVSLEGIWLIADDSTDTGPYNIFIDNLVGATNNVLTFETYTNGTTPGTSPMGLPGSGIHLAPGLNTPPNVSQVTTANPDVGTKCNQLNYQFYNTGNNGLSVPMTTVSAWSRYMDTSKAISMRILLLPPGCTTAALSVSQPADKVLTSGVADTITITPTTSNYGGTSTLTYKWKKNGVALSDTGDLGGTATATLQFSSPVCGDAGTYTCAVTNTITGGTQAGVYSTECNAIAVTFTKGSQTITFAPLTDRTYGDADFSPGATASSGLAVTYSSSVPATATIVANQVHIVGVGSTIIHADQGGDCNTNAATRVDQELQVYPAASTTAVISSHNPSMVGDAVTFTATVAKQAGVGPNATTPTGTIQWTIDGSPVGDPVTLNGAGQAQYGPITSLTAGTHTVEADYSSDDNRYYDGSGTLSPVQTVNSSGPPCGSAVNTNLAIVSLNDGYGTLRLDFQGVPGSQYHVEATADANPPSVWTPLIWTTNTAASGTGLWSCTVTNSASQQYYRSKADNCP